MSSRRSQSVYRKPTQPSAQLLNDKCAVSSHYLPSSSYQGRDDNTEVSHQLLFWRVKHLMKNSIKIHHSIVLTIKEIFNSYINVLLWGKKLNLEQGTCTTTHWHQCASGGSHGQVLHSEQNSLAWHSCRSPVRSKPCSDKMFRGPSLSRRRVQSNPLSASSTLTHVGAFGWNPTAVKFFATDAVGLCHLL